MNSRRLRAKLIHNPDAGFGSPSATELMAWLADAGYEPTYQSTQSDDFARALGDAGDLVVVAGGDGTVATVARLLAGTTLPMAILPLGTANNIARSLGAEDHGRDAVVALRDAPRRSLDVGVATAPWGAARFVESAGLGLFARFLVDAARDEAASNHDAGVVDLIEGRGERMRRMLARERAAHRSVQADGVDHSGEYLFVAALNIPFIGPGLELAPDADVADGQLELLLIRDEDRAVLDDFLDAHSNQRDTRLPFTTLRCAEVRLTWDAESGHLDDDVWPASDARPPSNGAEVTLNARAHAVTVLVPS